jgi:hypothetical protein
MSSGPFSLRNTFKTSEKHSMILFCAQLVAQSCGPPGPETGFEEIGIALPEPDLSKISPPVPRRADNQSFVLYPALVFETRRLSAG